MLAPVMQETNPPQKGNVPEFTVSTLSFSLKRTIEEGFARVRVRGEFSKVKAHSSGHIYTTLKDDQSVIDAVIWRATAARLAVKPEEGLEVICTGRVTTYPARSSYQIVIESIELAGHGALLKLLEDRKRKLAAEGLFDAARKQEIPFLPRRIGVVTSPTGSVIRDILHRLRDRFPSHVLVWPVAVQGAGAAEQVAAAIRGFDALEGALRPDVLIVARGGGSFEDLMPFNEESVVRAAAACRIPLISAVGHETDTTLIDYAADLRAPTPTAAAEKAVPERLGLLGLVMEDGQRLVGAAQRLLLARRQRLETLSARLGDPARLLENRTQRLDLVGHRLGSSFEKGLSRKHTALTATTARLGDPARLLENRAQRLNLVGHRLGASFEKGLNRKHAALTATAAQLVSPAQVIEIKRKTLAFRVESLIRAGTLRIEQQARRVEHAGRMLETLSFERVLDRGYAVVRGADGAPVTSAASLTPGQSVTLHLRDGRRGAKIEG